MSIIKVISLVLFYLITETVCYEYLTIGDLSNDVAEDFVKIFTFKDLEADCTDFPRVQSPKYFLYHRGDFENPIEINSTNIHQIKAEQKTVLVIPGWITSIDASPILSLKDAYLKRYDCNVIIVDWTYYSFKRYTTAYCAVKELANILSNFLCKLNRELEIELKDIHVLGHTLGGQIAGLLGEKTNLKCNQKIGRITGLDPAGPLFKFTPENERLSKTDALFVDVIHTDSLLGILQNCGQVDFHPNCVYEQPGCPYLPTLTNETLISDCFCGTIRSIELMTESVNSHQLIAVSCSLCSRYCSPDIITEVYTIMGEDCRKIPDEADNFLIYTRGSSSYGMGMEAYPHHRPLSKKFKSTPLL
ncbi:hypothetical protein FQA39_LY06414 [Lamprigera yunnana]|nr:hypothetical protein FQA39_LY06414 [Lamprigera yunnana]